MAWRKLQHELSIRLPNRHGWVHLRTLIAIRWIGIAGQIGALLVATFLLNYDLPIFASGATIAASALLNLWATNRLQRGPTINDRVAATYLSFDIIQLAILLYLTGGLINPFALLLLAPLTVGAAILRRGLVISLAAVMMTSTSALAFSPYVLPWGITTFPPIFLFGVWMALIMSALFIALYVYSVATGTAQIFSALQEAQLALGRTQKMAAVGALAAAAAHELGTPLSTIAVVAKELVHDLPPNTPQADDAALLLTQVDRCRTILAELAQRPDRSGDIATPFNALGVQTLLAMIAAPYENQRTQLVFELSPDNQGHEPQLRPLPEIQHGLANLLQNALQFAHTRVVLTLAWHPGFLQIQVQDDGPGLPATVLERIGEPYISTRNDQAGHMGLGIFIALNLLEKSGASLRYVNLSQGGTSAIVTWQGAQALGIIAS